MKFRYFKDDYVSFYIESIDETFGTLKDAVNYLYLTKQLIADKANMNEVNIVMQENSTDRSSKPNHILHFCQLAIFSFKFHKKKWKLDKAYLQFRDHIDFNAGFARWFSSNPSELYFSGYTDGDRDATIYFKEICEDRELADFLISHTGLFLEY